jgi:two-component system, OmpR family, sensor histidine kinase ChvG
VSDIAITTAEAGKRGVGASRKTSLIWRILAVNILALLFLAGGILYLDQYRINLLTQRQNELMTQAQLIAATLAQVAAEGDDPVLDEGRAGILVDRLADNTQARIRLFRADAAGTLALDSRFLAGDAAVSAEPLRPPGSLNFRRQSARFIDRALETFSAMPDPPAYQERSPQRLTNYPEARLAAAGTPTTQLWRMPDQTVRINVAVPVQRLRRVLAVLVLTSDTRDITKLVRREREASFKVFCTALAGTLLLSIFLSSTIVRPIRRLAIAADRVRQGRGRDVTVPRFVKRTDEIGELARALSDMTRTLHGRMDAIEAFAADVAHELKNPLSSVRSAIETLPKARTDEQRALLLGIISEDVTRLDRLITDISDASRLDAELSRARFDPLDLGALLTGMAEAYRARGQPRGINIQFAPPPPGSIRILASETRLAQVFGNLIDNAISFSPDGGTVRLGLYSRAGGARVLVEDDGPGVPDENRADIFKRFYSSRPDGEAFGTHSGLGLSIASRIVEAHDGRIWVENRMSGDVVRGARFIVSLPLKDAGPA